jgi:hypothetical protein
LNLHRLKNPLVLMPAINMVGAVSTFIYFSYILPPVTEEKQIPWEYSVLFLWVPVSSCSFFLSL